MNRMEALFLLKIYVRLSYTSGFLGAKIDENVVISRMNELKLTTLNRHERIMLAIKKALNEKETKNGESP